MRLVTFEQLDLKQASPRVLAQDPGKCLRGPVEGSGSSHNERTCLQEEKGRAYFWINRNTAEESHILSISSGWKKHKNFRKHYDLTHEYC